MHVHVIWSWTGQKVRTRVAIVNPSVGLSPIPESQAANHSLLRSVPLPLQPDPSLGGRVQLYLKARQLAPGGSAIHRRSPRVPRSPGSMPGSSRLRLHPGVGCLHKRWQAEFSLVPGFPRCPIDPLKAPLSSPLRQASRRPARSRHTINHPLHHSKVSGATVLGHQDRFIHDRTAQQEL
jgi:hypothetical protein